MPSEGDIVTVNNMLDPNGKNPKPRPAVIVSESNDSCIVVAISSRLDIATNETHVMLPWESGGHPKTGLNRKSAAVCFWHEEVCEDRIVATKSNHRFSKQHLDAIIQRMT